MDSNEGAALPEHEARRLAEINDRAERLLESQTAGIESLDAKIQNLISLGIAAIGGGAALGAFIAEKAGDLDSTSLKVLLLLFLLAGGVLNLVALIFFMRAYVGFSSGGKARIHAPDLDWLSEKAEARQWPHFHQHISILKGTRDAFNQNQLIMKENVDHRNSGVWLLLAAICAYAVTAFSFILALFLS